MSEEDSDDRMRALDERLARLKSAQESEHRKSSRNGETDSAATASGLGQAMRVGVELVAAVAVGGVLGWGLDQLFSTKPWLMIVMIFFGFAAGIRNVIRVSETLSAAETKRDAEK